jgi:glucosamine-6-phosphate deaminase
MQLLVKESYQAMSEAAARIVAQQILKKSTSVLGLPTGDTPLGMYKHLARMHDLGIVDFSRIHTFNLDEYRGLASEDPRTFAFYMREQFFQHVNIPKANIGLLNGNASNPEIECARYLNEIKHHDGIDMQILGIGLNGHIGFNEPGSNWQMQVGQVTISEQTRKRQINQFKALDEVPLHALTIGIRTIMQAKTVVLLAAGQHKALPVKLALTGPIDKSFPASILQLHTKLTVILDQLAAAQLEGQIDEG